MLGLPKRFVIFDTEYTCWEGSQERGWSGTNEYKEIVQIGAIKADAATLQETDSFSIFVRPVKNPYLSEFFVELTGITQARVDSEGIDLNNALARFAEWTAGLPCFSFGRDPLVIRENCALICIPFPFDQGRFFDVRDVFAKHGIPAHGYTSGIILRAFGKVPLRRAHDGLNDARSILDGLRQLVSGEGEY